MEVQNASLTGLARINLERVKLGLYEMVLACNSDLEKCLGMNTWTIDKHLPVLEDAKEIGAHKLGATSSRPVKWVRLTTNAASGIGMGNPGWNDDGGLANLLKHLPIVENFARWQLPMVTNRIYSFQWVLSAAIDADVRL